MQQIDFYMVDAFTTTTFGGNAAAVCPLTDWLPDETLLKMAQQHNQSETAFVVPMRMALSCVGLPLRVKSICVGMPRLPPRMSSLNIWITRIPKSNLLPALWDR